MKSGVLRKKEKKFTLTKMAISMQLFFRSVNSTPTKSDLEIDKENTQKEKDEQNIYFFERKTPNCIFFDLWRL